MLSSSQERSHTSGLCWAPGPPYSGPPWGLRCSVSVFSLMALASAAGSTRRGERGLDTWRRRPDKAGPTPRPRSTPDGRDEGWHRVHHGPRWQSRALPTATPCQQGLPAAGHTGVVPRTGPNRRQKPWKLSVCTRAGALPPPVTQPDDRWRSPSPKALTSVPTRVSLHPHVLGESRGPSSSSLAYFSIPNILYLGPSLRIKADSSSLADVALTARLWALQHPREGRTDPSEEPLGDSLPLEPHRLSGVLPTEWLTQAGNCLGPIQRRGRPPWEPGRPRHGRGPQHVSVTGVRCPTSWWLHAESRLANALILLGFYSQS